MDSDYAIAGSQRPERSFDHELSDPPAPSQCLEPFGWLDNLSQALKVQIIPAPRIVSTTE